MTVELGKILDKYVPEFPKEVGLKLPQLKKVGGKLDYEEDEKRARSLPPKIKLPKLKKV